MKNPQIRAALLCAGLMAISPRLSGQPQPAPTAATKATGPMLVFPANEYNFGHVISGELVKHVFIVSNSGDQTLVISNVAPGCHCTTVGNWAHQIEPGKAGEIPIQFDSRGIRGDVVKPIRVFSNCKLTPLQILTLRGSVIQPFKVNPQTVFFNVTSDAPSNSTVVVHITNQLDVPVTLSNLASTSNSFKAELKTIEPGKVFEVIITAMAPFAPGRNTATISLATSVPKMPVINIQTYAIVQPPVSVTPPKLFLPSSMNRWMTNLVTISGNGNKTLAVSDPEASDKRIVVQLKETVPGRTFHLTAAFPPGFLLAPGQHAEVTVKSNHPDYPVIVVPVSQRISRPP